MSENLARALAAPAPAAQPMGNQDMLARILMGNPDPRLPQYPVMQSAEGRGFAPLPTSMGDMGARMGAVLRGQVEPTPGERYGMDVPLGWVAGSGGRARDGIRAYHGGAPDLNKLSLSAATNPRERAIFATNNFDDAERFGVPYEVKIDPSQMGSYRWREFSDDPIYDPDIMAKVLQKARDEGRAGAIIQGVQNFEYGNPSTTYAVFDDKLIDILRRYGLAGMLTGGAASQAQAGEPAP